MRFMYLGESDETILSNRMSSLQACVVFVELGLILRVKLAEKLSLK